ncbi:MAG: hypothetical protein V4634_03895 [Pseudomonadota bacterium]
MNHLIGKICFAALATVTLLASGAETMRLGNQADAPQVMRIDDAKDLALIRQTRPAHFKKIQQILADIQDQAEGKVSKWMQTRFDAREISYEPMLLVTAPPKRKLAFRLDDVRYEGVIVMSNYQPLMTPAR